MHILQFSPLKKRKVGLLVFFVLIMFVPAMTTGWLGVYQEVPSENRTLASFPEVSISFESFKSFPSKFDKYIADNFGFRRDLILLYNRVKFELFGTSPDSTVIIGQDRWLYKYLREQQKKVNVPPLMRRQWRIHFEERRDWLRERGIDFAVVVAPNKHSVYPEFLPAHYEPELENTKLQQFLGELAGRSELKVVDLVPRLLSEKKERLLYYKTDTHWNYVGAYFGYLELADYLDTYFPELDRIDLESAKIVLQSRDTNLYRIMGVLGREDADYLVPEGGWGFKVGQPDTAELKRISERGAVSVTESQGGNSTLPRVVVIGDSYLGWFRNYIGHHFSRGVFVNLWGTQWRHEETFPLQLFTDEKPDLVLMQFKESRLGFCGRPYCVSHPKKMTNPEDVRQSRLRRLYAESPEVAHKVPFSVPNMADSGIKQFDLDLSELPKVDSRVWIARIMLGDVEGELVVSAKNGADSRCAKFQEVVTTHVDPSRPEVLLCIEEESATGRVNVVELKGIGSDKADIRSVEMRPHSDIPERGYWKKTRNDHRRKLNRGL